MLNAPSPRGPAPTRGDRPPALVERVQFLLLDHPAGAALCMAAFLAATLVLAMDRTFLHDEGLFSFPLSRGLWSDFWAFFFLHKGKPLNLLFYAVPSRFGLDAFFAVHAIVGTAGIGLVCAAARRMGIGHPNVAGWVMATCTSYAVASSNGYANSDGATLTALFLLLYVSDRRMAAAVVLGLLPFSRYELSFITAFFLAVAVLRDRDFRFVLAALVLPAAYAVGGAIYNADPLWLYNTFIQPNTLPEDLRNWRLEHTLPDFLDHVRRSFGMHSPLLLVFAPFGLDRRDRRSVTLFAAMVLFYGTMTVIQYTEFMHFDTSVRHHTTTFPIVALVVAQGLSSSGLLARRVLPPLARRSGAIAWLFGRVPYVRLGLIALAIAFTGWRLADPGNEEKRQHNKTHALVAEATGLGLLRGNPAIYIDLLPPRYDRCAGFDEDRTFHLVNGSIRWEFLAMGRPEQLASVFANLGKDGWLFDPDALPIRTDALYLVSNQPRSAAWRARLEKAGAESTALDGTIAYRFGEGRSGTGADRTP